MRCNVTDFIFTGRPPVDFSPVWYSCPPEEEECRWLYDFIQTEHSEDEWQTYLDRLSQCSTFYMNDWAVPLRIHHPQCGDVDLLDPEDLALVKGYPNLVRLLLRTRPNSFLTRQSFSYGNEDSPSLTLSPACVAALFSQREVLELMLEPDDPDEVNSPWISYLSPSHFFGENLLLTPYACALLGNSEGCAAYLKSLGAACDPDLPHLAALKPYLGHCQIPDADSSR